MTSTKFIVILVIGLGYPTLSYDVAAAGDAANRTPTRPDAEMPWPGQGGAFVTLGSGGQYIFGVSLKPRNICAWRWEEETLRKEKEVAVDSLAAIWVSGNRVLYSPSQSKLTMQDAGAGTRTVIWPGVPKWFVQSIRPSRSGSCAVALLAEDDEDAEQQGVRPVFIDLKNERVVVLPPLRRKEGVGGMGRSAIPSDDGKYIAITDWRYGVAVVDVAAQKMLRDIQPKGEISNADAAFSPDGKTLYMGGGQGCVYAIEVATGRTLHRWWATDTDESVNGQRIVSIVPSPDGRLVAAGTGPEGLVYVATGEGKKIGVFEHGSTIYTMSFSPDSKLLATVAAGQIKVWKMPEAAPPTRPR